MLRRSSVDDQRDAPVQFAAHVGCGRRADATEAIGARRGERFSEMRTYFLEDGMRAHPHRDGLQTGRDEIGYDRAAGKDERERAGPELRDESFDKRTAFVGNVRQTA